MHITTKAMKLFSLPLITLLLVNVLLHAQAPTDWVLGTQYNKGSLVSYEGIFYNAIQVVPGSVGGTPDTLTDYWVDIFSSRPDDDPGDPPNIDDPGSDFNSSNLTPPEDEDVSSKLINISTRGYVGTGNDVMIAGFVIEGDATATLKCMVGVSSGGLVEKDDFLILKDAFIILTKDGVEIARNNDWTELSAEDQQSIQDANQVPGSTKDSALVMDLGPGVYGVTVVGVGNTTGITNVGVNDLGQNGGTGSCRILNISTRGKVLTGDSVMIAGFVISGSNETDTLRVKLSNNGPSLGDDPSSGFVSLKDPFLQLVAGATDSNNNWSERPDSEKSYLTENNQTPSDSRESFMLKTLAPNAYGIVMSGVGGTTGNAIVGVTIAD